MAQPLTPEQIMEIVRATVPRLEELTGGVPRDHLYAVTAYGWSVNQQLAHLRSCQEILGGNVLRIVGEEHPAWKGTAPTARQAEYMEWKFEPAFDAFRTGRAELLAVLEPMPPEAWDRTATVSVPPGKVYEYTARYYGDWLARHERGHLKHIARVLGDLAAAAETAPGS